MVAGVTWYPAPVRPACAHCRHSEGSTAGLLCLKDGDDAPEVVRPFWRCESFDREPGAEGDA